MASTVGRKKMGWKLDMEKEDGFKLMLHERDFVAGTTIRRNIINAIEQSRRMIVILSRLEPSVIEESRRMIVILSR